MHKLKTSAELLCKRAEETCGIVTLNQKTRTFEVTQKGTPQQLHRGSEHAAGLDIAAPCGFGVRKGMVTVIDCGWSFAPPEGFALVSLPRSSTGVAGMQICNTMGLLDNDYRGSVKFFLTLADWAAEDELWFDEGNRFAQLKLSYSPTPIPSEVEDLPASDRGEKGYGSSGA